LEHIGQQPNVFLAFMQEMYRVCRYGAIIQINVPHPMHDEFRADPTHVRPVLAQTMLLFSKKANLRSRENNAADSCFALQLGVDFEIVDNALVFDPRFEHLQSDPNWQQLALTQNNIVREIRLKLKVNK